MVEIANQRFGNKPFRCRQLMDATEQEIRRLGLWTSEDEPLSSSVGTKSIGLANTDYRFSDLARRGVIARDRHGIWRLVRPEPPPAREFLQPPFDNAEPPPRIETQVNRVIRNTPAARALKCLYEFHCQVCGVRIEPTPDTFYVEVHHVRPLGGGHNGLDTASNMLVLCPNHHAMFDFGIPRFISVDSLDIAGASYQLNTKHHLAPDAVAYHNNSIHNRKRSG
jgi:putative restriction endonuclease